MTVHCWKSCRRCIVKYFGNNIKHSRSLLTSHQCRNRNWFYICLNYCKDNLDCNLFPVFSIYFGVVSGLLRYACSIAKSCFCSHALLVNLPFMLTGLCPSIFQVGSIIELRRSYQAYNVMPSLSKALRRYGV